MSEPIRAQIEVEKPAGCPLARASTTTDSTIEHVSKTVSPDSHQRIVEEFAIDSEASPDHPGFEHVFETATQSIYRYARSSASPCVCACTELHGCNVFDVHARDGSLYLTFHSATLETVQDVYNDLEDLFGDVHVHFRTPSRDYRTSTAAIFDRSELTEKQQEALQTSFEMGYFDYPTGANATAVANELGISPSTFRGHLDAAQRKLFDAVLDD
ncbi:helix-turn-helix domain-containing protein [Haloferax sp. DFSO52]|uniref:helix-turn-helix domain-containing protein n=1 Tax=Haloferax sp. DFSO52 TaxID=3388505 RepID=UPI003A8A6F84